MLFESLAITLYLAKKHSPGTLYPGTLEGEARAWQWSLWAVTEVDRGVNIWSLHAVRLPPEERDAAKRAEALKVLVAPFKVLDAAVTEQPYLLGNDFTVADLNVAAVISRADRDGSERSAQPQGLADALPGAAGGARGAGAEDQGRQRDAGRRDPADRADQSPVSDQTPVRSISARPSQEALALHQQGRLDEAEKLYTRVLKAQRDNFDALHLLGMLNHQRGKAGEAYRLITAALKVNRARPTRCRISRWCCTRSSAATRRWPASTRRWRWRPAISTRSTTAATCCSISSARPRRSPPSTRCWRASRVTSRRWSIAAMRCAALGRGGRGARRLRRGARRSRRDIRWRSTIAATRCARSAASRRRSRPTTARSRLRPTTLNAWINRGLTLAALNRHQDALASYGKALSLQPDNADAHFNAALSLLTLGDYARGFAEYEWRWKRTGDDRAAAIFASRPGSARLRSRGKTILLHAEQGLGDTMHVRALRAAARARRRHAWCWRCSRS